MLMDLLRARHSIRRYEDTQISREDMEKVLEAGALAPNAGGGQRSMLVGLRNRDLVRRVGRMNMARFSRENLAGSFVSSEQPSVIDDPSIEDGFYGAPAAAAIFGQKNFLFKEADAFCCAENMVLMATELGLASCIVSRGPETFDSPEGQELLREWGVPENFVCICFVILGVRKGPEPRGKPRRPGRCRIIE